MEQDPEHTSQLRSLVRAMEAFRDLDPGMPLAQALSLLLIAQSGETSLKDLAERADLAMATASRYITFFTKHERGGVKGVGLITATEDPQERRKKVIALTPKGHAFINRILGGKPNRTA